MQIVIDIDDETYADIKKGKIYSSMRDVPQESVVAIANGIPLPKGHGDLIDEKDLSLMTIHMIDGTLVCDAPTIIESNTESEE